MGQCTLTANTGTLAVRIDAAGQDGLAQIRGIITRDFARFSSRDPMTVDWQEQPETPEAAPFPATTGLTSRPLPRHRRSTSVTVLLILAVVVVAGLHVGLAGTVVAQSGWTGLATNLVVAAVITKVALIAWARHRIRRRRTASTQSEA